MKNKNTRHVLMQLIRDQFGPEIVQQFGAGRVVVVCKACKRESMMDHLDEIKEIRQQAQHIDDCLWVMANAHQPE